MKKIIICCVLFSFQMFPQSYLNILFSDGSYQNSHIAVLQKITLSTNGQLISFHLTDGTTTTENITDMVTMTIDSFQLGQPLPVELASFIISLIGSSVELTWRTETEVTNYGFEIERDQESGISTEWEKIGFVEGYGNSNSPRDYSFTDKLLSNNVYHYRLKQIDTDGNYEYSTVLTIGINILNNYALNQNYPNPFNPFTNLNYSIELDGFVTIKVYDIMGSEVFVLVNENMKAGSYTTTFEGGNYASGVYICRINSGDFSSSIKMTLLK